MAQTATMRHRTVVRLRQPWAPRPAAIAAANIARIAAVIAPAWKGRLVPKRALSGWMKPIAYHAATQPPANEPPADERPQLIVEEATLRHVLTTDVPHAARSDRSFDAPLG